MKFTAIENAAIQAAIDHVHREFGVEITAEEIKGRKRHRALFEARKAAAWHMRESGMMTLQQIGQAMGGRDHSTVDYWIGRATGYYGADIAGGEE